MILSETFVVKKKSNADESSAALKIKLGWFGCPE